MPEYFMFKIQLIKRKKEVFFETQVIYLCAYTQTSLERSTCCWTIILNELKLLKRCQLKPAESTHRLQTWHTEKRLWLDEVGKLEQKRICTSEGKATSAEESISERDRQQPTGWSEKDPLHLTASSSIAVSRQK